MPALRRRLLLVLCLIVILGGLSFVRTAAAPASAQGEQANAWTITRQNLRATPSTAAAILATLDGGTALVLEGRTADSGWVLAHTVGGGLRGWLRTGYLQFLLGFDVAALPVSTDTGSVSAAPPQSGPGAAPVSGPTATVLFTLNAREGPGQAYGQLGQFPAQAQVVLEARTADSAWVVARHAAGTLRGWVAAGYLLADQSALAALPVSSDLISALPSPALPPDLPEPPTTQAVIDITLSNETLARAREIFAAGQAAGRRADSFIAIGDSAVGGNVDTLPMFHAIVNNLYDLGEYAHLQQTINFFSRTFSFYVERGTARAGNGTLNILDPLLADPTVCEPGENNLACEIRRQQPSVAIIYIGFVDLNVTSAAQYTANLDAILQQLMSSGVIPVLTTLTADFDTLDHYGNTDRFNEMNTNIRAFAAAYHLPLIDLQAAAAGLPHQGTVSTDGVHLSSRVPGYISFAGDQHVYGNDLRELLTLLMLDALRVNVLGG